MNRGRPPNRISPSISKSDIAIARTVRQLVYWGFPIRPTCEIVAIAARDILKRTDHTCRLSLSADRIEQIYEDCCRTSLSRWFSRKRYVKQSLHSRCPNKTASAEELARKLLENEGSWPEEQWAIHGDLELTPKAHTEYIAQRDMWPKIKLKRGN